MNAEIFGPCSGSGFYLQRRQRTPSHWSTIRRSSSRWSKANYTCPKIRWIANQRRVHSSGAFQPAAATSFRIPESSLGPHGLHKCGVEDDKRQVFRCKKLKHVSGAKHKYTVNVIVSGSGQALPPLDPIIFDH